MQRLPENAGNTVLSGEVWVNHTYINAPVSVRKGKKRGGLARHLLQVAAGIDSCGHVLPRVQGEGGELGGPGCPLSPQSGQPAVCPGQAHVCRAPADPPQERSLVAERKSVPEGKDGEPGVRQIPVVLLQKNLLVRKTLTRQDVFAL